MTSESSFGDTPITRLVFPQTEADYLAVLTRLRQGITHPAELSLEESTLQLVLFRDRCEGDLGRPVSLGQVAEAIRVSMPQGNREVPTRPVAEPHAPANAAGQVERFGTVEVPIEHTTPREIPARPAQVEELPGFDAFDQPPIPPTLIKQTLLGVAAGVATGFFSRKLGAAIVGWSLLRFVVFHYAPVAEDDEEEGADARDPTPSSNDSHNQEADHDRDA